MERLLIFLTCLLLSSCGGKNSNLLGFDTRLKIVNNSEKDIYYCTSGSYPELNLKDGSYGTRIKLSKNESRIITQQCCWEDYLDIINGTLIINIFDATIFESNTWQTIKDKKLIEKQLLFTIAQLDSLNWTIEYK